VVSHGGTAGLAPSTHFVRRRRATGYADVDQDTSDAVAAKGSGCAVCDLQRRGGNEHGRSDQSDPPRGPIPPNYGSHHRLNSSSAWTARRYRVSFLKTRPARLSCGWRDWSAI